MGTSTKTIQYRYDANRNRSLMIDPDGGRTTYSYDVLNRITSLINPQGERTTYAYDADGRRTVKKLANGTRASFTYDAANRLSTLANLKSDNSVISKFDYTYDKAGNRTGVTEADGSRVTYLYDATYQLTGEHRTGTTPYRNTFTYDSRGNRTLKNESGTRTTYAYDAANQLVYAQAPTGRTTYTFDNNGNQTGVLAPNGDRTTTTWDYENRTTGVQLPSGTRNTMAYEPDGLRVKLEDSTGTKKFIFDQQNYLAETDQNNDTQVVYTNEPQTYGNLISQRRSGATSYYHYEALGSTRQLSNASEVVTDTYLYDAWGNVLTSSGSTVNPFQWTGNVGYYFDPDTGNFYIRARTYRPTIGRWLSIDPLGFRDGLNWYRAYFIPNTIDPSGMYEELEEPLPWDEVFWDKPFRKRDVWGIGDPEEWHKANNPPDELRQPFFPYGNSPNCDFCRQLVGDVTHHTGVLELSTVKLPPRVHVPGQSRKPQRVKCQAVLVCNTNCPHSGGTTFPGTDTVRICINPNSPGNLRSTLHHELVHFKQVCRNSLEGATPCETHINREREAYEASCAYRYPDTTSLEFELCVNEGIAYSADRACRGAGSHHYILILERIEQLREEIRSNGGIP